ncbi:nuclear transport factor 2 family protein [soil metagenome]
MDTSSEENGIRETINYYAEGMRTGSVEILKKGFHQQAILCGYLGDEMIAAPIEGLFDWVESNLPPAETGEAFGCAILALAVTGRVAAATVRETSHEGDVIDYFHLLKVTDRWWIVSKLWDAE